MSGGPYTFVRNGPCNGGFVECLKELARPRMGLKEGEIFLLDF
jgi:hypothetical protein